MTTPINRDSLPLKAGQEIRFSTYRERQMGDYSNALLICLHPGWGGYTPSPHFGELFLVSMFIPAFAGTGALLVAPDCPSGAWNNPQSRRAILELLDYLRDRYALNPKQVSLVGYSAGGWGAWYLLREDPERFCSAILFACLPVIDAVEQIEDNFPKCEELLANRLDEWLSRLPDIPIYMIHSRQDELIPYEDARRAYQALVEDRRRVEFNSLQGVGHFEGEGYIEPMQDCVQWLIDTWSTAEMD